MRLLFSAPCRRCQLSSNVRPRRDAARHHRLESAPPHEKSSFVQQISGSENRVQQPTRTPRLKARRAQIQAPASPVPTPTAARSVVNERGSRIRTESQRIASAVHPDRRAARMKVPFVQSRPASNKCSFTARSAPAATSQRLLQGRLRSVPRSSPLASSVARPNPSVKLSPNGGPRGPGRRYAVHFLQPGPRVPPLVPAYLQR